MIGRDKAVLERFYRAYYDEVVRYLSRRVTDPQDVADLVADTFLAAMVSAARFDPARGRVVPWLIGIAHNQVRHFQRWRHRHHDAVERAMARPALDGDDIAELERRIDAEAHGAHVLRLVGRLPERQRELVALVDIQGLTPAEAARVLGITAGLARIRLHRARAALRHAITFAPNREEA